MPWVKCSYCGKQLSDNIGVFFTVCPSCGKKNTLSEVLKE